LVTASLKGDGPTNYYWPSVKRRAKRAASDKRQASSNMRQYVQFKKI